MGGPSSGDRPNQFPLLQSPLNSTSCTWNWTQTAATQLDSFPSHPTAPKGHCTLEVSQVSNSTPVLHPSNSLHFLLNPTTKAPQYTAIKRRAGSGHISGLCRSHDYCFPWSQACNLQSSIKEAPLAQKPMSTNNQESWQKIIIIMVFLPQAVSWLWRPKGEWGRLRCDHFKDQNIVERAFVFFLALWPFR